MSQFTFHPIGIFCALEQEKYELEHQPISSRCGEIKLHPHQNFEQALQDLDSFSHIWVHFVFDRNSTWKPKVTPPRAEQKRGLFATRSPHRPNPIGQSCVPLIRIDGLSIFVGQHDLLDQTPILDIKPYLPYVDCVQEASMGWAGQCNQPQFTIDSTAVAAPIAFLKMNGIDLIQLVKARLEVSPFPGHNRRIQQLVDNTFELAVKTWRLRYHIVGNQVVLEQVSSGYCLSRLQEPEDRWGDKAIHRAFNESQKGKNS